MTGIVTATELNLQLDSEKVILNPDDNWFIENLKPYYVITADGQYLFASTQPGRRPDRAFYMVPEGYKPGKGQPSFPKDVGLRLFDVVKEYLETARVIVQDGVQGEKAYQTNLRVFISVENMHSAYIGWMGLKMVFPPEDGADPQCVNYIVQEPLPDAFVQQIRGFWPDFDPDEPLTLYDLTRMDQDFRRVMSLRIDYFGGAFKKPNLTLVWNRAESRGLVSYHGGATSDRILKGLSGTGKTTLTVGPQLEQDDACLGLPVYDGDRVVASRIIGLEASSFAKSEGLVPTSPEWLGLMASKETRPDGSWPVVLAMNIDCAGVEYVTEEIDGHTVKVPRRIAGQEIGSLQCTRYAKSGTTNGRFVFDFSELNPNWSPETEKWLKMEGYSFRRFDVMEPVIRVTDPVMAVALDSACESIVTSAVAGRVPGSRTRSYAATDFMCREQSQQALLKLRMYCDLGLGLDGKLTFFVLNTGFVGEFDLQGRQIRITDAEGKLVVKIDEATGEPDLDAKGDVRYVGQGEKITVADSKAFLELIDHRKIQKWIKNPIFGYLVPDPGEMEELHGLTGFRRRFNLLRFYTPEEIVEFAESDIRERTQYLKGLFRGQAGEEELQDVVHVWAKCKIPSAGRIRSYYETHYGKVDQRSFNLSIAEGDGRGL
ncbi:MAG TPA: hypothetical protein VMX14_04945 [Anaerolineae bacterium]|nr:hypothetical protein [Anaerolineae bacterium]